ncbi:MAG TPA: LysR substrate-binding domain-containing protein [Polyangiaceae bacterium]|nr:LysR substrate-binding domain-containing protein [Polyangiaceae bacterium]
MGGQILDLAALAAYAQVVAAGGFSGAARALGVPRQAVHRRVTALERELGLELLERTTRRVRPTDAGRRLFGHAERVLAEARAATEAMRAARAAPSGTLRLTAPELFGELVIGPALAKFLARWPAVRAAALFSLEREDLLGRDLDLAIRLGPLREGSRRARRLGAVPVVCCAAPALIAGAAEPVEHPGALASWPALHYGRDPGGAPVRWRFQKGRQAAELRLEPRLCSTSARVVRDAALAGLGVARLPRLVCEHELGRGALVEVLAAWRGEPTPVHAVFSARPSSSPTLGAFLQTLAEHIRGEPWAA